MSSMASNHRYKAQVTNWDPAPMIVSALKMPIRFCGKILFTEILQMITFI